jgi:hypothetical protein
MTKMKKTLAFVVLFLCVELQLWGQISPASAQLDSVNLVAEKSSSKIAKIMSTIDFYKTEYYLSRKIEDVKWNVLIITDLYSGNKHGCIRIDLKPTDNIFRTYYQYIDLDEIDICVQSLSKMIGTISESTPKIKTELLFKTSDIEFMARDEFEVWKLYIRPWHHYTEAKMNPRAISDIIKYMTQAKDLIESKIQ